MLVNPDSGLVQVLELLMPVPFVTEYAVNSLHHRAARQYQQPFSGVDPYAIALERMEGSPLLAGKPDALPMMPFVYAVIGNDDRVRLTLVFRVEGDNWMGRYMYHLPTTLTTAQLKQPQPDQLQQLRNELITGASQLRELMERDARNELNATESVDIGSYYLVGSRLLGLIPASIMHFPDTRLVEEGPDHVVVRSSGNLKADATSGGLVFGVHYFRKDQLHTYKKKGDAP